jgi:hypothetical protein
VLILVSAVGLLTVGCASGGGQGSAPDAASGTTDPSSTAAGLPRSTSSSYKSIAALAQALNDKSIECKLSYPGLKDDVTDAELSICTIDGQQAYLRVWTNTEFVDKFLVSPDGNTGLVAVGSNWTITLQSPATANRVAAALGGTAPGPQSATGTSSTVRAP